MEFYLFVLVILFCTALADLYVGVANDAVNFLNSAIGSKVATRVTIIVVASLGVVVGTTFSSGMMEVARKGIFNPEMFTFHEVMVIFLAVMLTDIILLDLYNTFSLPTSTTVSIVFELLGGSVAVAVMKVSRVGGGLGDVLTYLNAERVVTIISGIGLSIVVAFIFGVLIQFITRVIFTFDYEKNFRRYGALYCASALTAITYFILVKGARGSAVLSDDQADWIAQHLAELLIYGFVVWTILWQIVISFTRLPVLRIIVLIGTFALALSFAANDLVNFIGAPLGALGAFELASDLGGDPHAMTMEGLAVPVRANPWLLLLGGLIMVSTLWFSRKARSVTQTEVKLGQQNEGVERFESSALSRTIVRIGLAVFSGIKRLVPAAIQRKIAERLDPSRARLEPGPDGQLPSFDLLRATVNFMVASALISFGTSLKLPLSTTFVTFMVAMSTSLADRSWGRESAVYRVNGVITVIGGWFFTAFLAFVTSFAFAYAIEYGKLPAILGLVGLGFFFYFRTGKLHNSREEQLTRLESQRGSRGADLGRLENNMKLVSRYLREVSTTISECYSGLIASDRTKLRNAVEHATRINKESDEMVADILDLIRDSSDEERGAAPRYARKIGSLQIVGANITSLANASHTYVDNNHTPPSEEQAAEMLEVEQDAQEIIATCVEMLEQQNFGKLPALRDKVFLLKEKIRNFDRRQMKRIKGGASKTRQSLLFLGTLNKVERIADQGIALVNLYQQSHEDLSD